LFSDVGWCLTCDREETIVGPLIHAIFPIRISERALSVNATLVICLYIDGLHRGSSAALILRQINRPLSGRQVTLATGLLVRVTPKCDTADCRLFFWASYLLGFFRCECSGSGTELFAGALTDRSKEHSECPNPGGSFVPILSL
jgi:hypothetical protein